MTLVRHHHPEDLLDLEGVLVVCSTRLAQLIVNLPELTLLSEDGERRRVTELGMNKVIDETETLDDHRCNAPVVDEVANDLGNVELQGLPLLLDSSYHRVHHVALA